MTIPLFLADKQPLSLFPQQEVRDIGADGVSPTSTIATIAKKEVHPQNPEKKERPYPDTHAMMANESARSGLSPHHESEDEALENSLKNLHETYSSKALKLAQNFANEVAPYADVSFHGDTRTDIAKKNASSGADTLRNIVGVPKLVPENLESILVDISAAASADAQIRMYRILADLRNLDRITTEAVNKGNSDSITVYSDAKHAMIKYLNEKIPQIVDKTPQNMQEVVENAYNTIIYENGDPEIQEMFLTQRIQAARDLVRHTSSNSPMLEMVIAPKNGEQISIVIPSREQQDRA